MSNTSVTKDGNIVVVKSTDGAANNTVSIQETSTPSITVTYPDVGAPSSITKEGNTVVVKSTDGTPTAVIVQQPNNSIVTVNTLGPIGPQGPQGTPGDFDVSTVVTTSSFNAFTASYNTGSFTGSFIGILIGTSSWANNYNEIDPIFVAKSGSLATTGSNIFIGNQTITGSILLKGDQYISGSIYIPDNNHSIYFSGSNAASRLKWNDTDGTLDLGLKGGAVTLQIGQENVIRVVNKTGADLLESEYKVVRIRRVDEGGAQGQRLAVVLSQANNDPNSVDTLGVVTENITVNQEGFITTFGLVNNIDTRGTLQGETWNEGDVLYLSPTVAGGLTNIKPQAPNHTIIVGFVVYKQQNNGKIFVKVDNGYEIDELHNVRISTSSLSSGDLLMYDTNVWYNTKQLSGSYGITGSLNITGSVFLNGLPLAGNSETDPIFTAVSKSFVTTSSFNTFTSSYYLDSSSFATRINNISVNVDLSGYTTTSSFNTFTSSYKTDSASFANRINNITINTSSLVTISSFNAFTSSYNTGSFSGSFKGQLIGTASWATNAISANNAISALGANSANIAELANTVKIQEYNNTLDFRPLLIPEISGSGASYTSTLNNAGNLIYNGEKNLLRFDTTLDQFNNPLFPSLEIGSSSTGSLIVYGAIWAKQLNVLPSTITFVDSINTASAVTLTELKFENSKLFLTTGSYSGSFIGNLIGTASWTSNYNESDPIFVAKSGSFTLTSSFNTFTSSYKNDSSSFANRINNITFDTSSLISTSSFNAFTSSYKIDSSSFNNKIDNLTNSTSSYVLNSQTSSFATLTSNTFNGNQIISGTLVITGDVTVFGSSSLSYLTASQLNIGTNIISVNIFEPAQRFGGLRVYDSGSLSHQATASLLWDSEKNHWIYQNASGSTYNGGMLLSGPRNFGALGDEPSLTSNYIVKSQGGDHITTSSLFDSGGLVRINSNTQITGSLEVSLGITGSLFGTSSWAQNYNEIDPVFISVSGSFLTTSSFNLVSSSFVKNNQTSSMSVGTASYTPNAIVTASVFTNTLVFKKGDGTEFNLTVEASPGVASQIQTQQAEIPTDTHFITFVHDTDLSPSPELLYTYSTLTYKPDAGVLISTAFKGDLQGNADSATDSTNTSNTFISEDTSSNVTRYITFTNNTNGNAPQFVDTSGLTYNPFTNIITSTASYAITASYALNAGGTGVSTLIDTLGARIYTEDTSITAGSKGYKHIAYNADIIKTRTIANTNGNIDINIKRSGTTLGTISLLNQSSSLDTTLTGWTTQLNTNDLLEFYVSQSSTYITDISIFIDIQSR